MSLNITPDMIAAAYELLKTTPPYRRWKLPPAEEIEFRVIRSDKLRGTFHRVGKRRLPVISVSSKTISRLNTLIKTVAHEMVHLHEDTNHQGRGDIAHSARFKGFQRSVCKHHGFEEGMF